MCLTMVYQIHLKITEITGINFVVMRSLSILFCCVTVSFKFAMHYGVGISVKSNQPGKQMTFRPKAWLMTLKTLLMLPLIQTYIMH